MSDVVAPEALTPDPGFSSGSESASPVAVVSVIVAQVTGTSPVVTSAATNCATATSEALPSVAVTSVASTSVVPSAPPVVAALVFAASDASTLGNVVPAPRAPVIRSTSEALAALGKVHSVEELEDNAVAALAHLGHL